MTSVRRAGSARDGDVAKKETEAPFLIAGGGIGGLAAARALALKGYRSIVLEQADTFGEIGAGIQLGPNVHRAFDSLQVADEMRAIAFYPQNIIMMDSLTQEEVARIELGARFEAHFGKPYGVIHRADLHKVLLEACQGMDGIALHAGTAVTGYEDDGERVTVATATNDNFTGRALIGADGLWSTIRPTIIGDGEPIVSGHIAYRAVLPTEEVPEHLRINEVILWAGPKTHLVHYPLHRGEIFNLVAVFHSDRYEEGWDQYGDTEELNQRFAGEHENVLMMLDKIETWKMWVLVDREPVKNWSRGRVTLLGDAAHPMLQYLAQGACMAIEDAVCLANKIEAGNGDFAAAFQAYQNDRYLRTARVQLMARVYGDFYHAAGVTSELRYMMLSRRTPEQAYDGVNWLYAGVDRSGAAVG